MNPFEYPESWKPHVSFRNATFAVILLFLLSNGMWYARGRPRTWQLPWIMGPAFVAADIILVTLGFIAVYRIGKNPQHYRTAVTIYAMLLANVVGLVRTWLVLRMGL